MLTVLTILTVIALWWGSTGAIFWLGRRDVGTYPATLLGMTVLASFAVLAIIISGGEKTVWSAFIAFGAGLALWAWHEASFLLGFITGSRREPMSENAHGWKRFREAFLVLSHHELALAATVLVLVGMSWLLDNQMAVCTFTLLWLLRISAKLALFTGVPHFSDELMPNHLSHISSYFRKAPTNRLVQGTVVVGLLVLTALIHPVATGALTSEFDLVSRTVLATLLGLAVLEHLFLLIPFRDSALWNAFARQSTAEDTPSDPTFVGRDDNSQGLPSLGNRAIDDTLLRGTV